MKQTSPMLNLKGNSCFSTMSRAFDGRIDPTSGSCVRDGKCHGEQEIWSVIIVKLICINGEWTLLLWENFLEESAHFSYLNVRIISFTTHNSTSTSQEIR